MLSIIILCYNSPDMEFKCIQSTIRHTTVPYEIILINNAGTEESKQQCKRFADGSENISYIELDVNHSVANAWNWGINAAKYDYIAILNNDLVLTDQWDKKLMEPLLTHPEGSIAMTGPTLSYCATVQRDNEAYKKRMEMSQSEIDALAHEYSCYCQDEERIVENLSGSCFMTTRKTIEIVGLFDEDFKIGSGEEAEWEFRAKKAGMVLWWVKHCYVHHYGHVSFGIRDKEEQDFDSEAIWKSNAKLYNKKIKK